MSNYSSPDFTPQQIADYLSEYGIASVSPEDILRPSGEFVCSIYAGVLSFLDPLGVDDEEHIDFVALEGLESPEYHSESIRIINFYHKVKGMLAFIKVDLNLRDLLRPDPVRTTGILSTVINFLLYREEKLAILRHIVDQCNVDRRKELESRIAELKREILEHEMVRDQEKPVVQELEAEVRVLKQTIQERNKEQVGLKTRFKQIKDKVEAVSQKISQADFELVENEKENSELSSKIVQSPDKLQRALEEKKLKRTEVKNAERSAMLNVQTKTTALEIYSKACEKISKHLAKVQALQEQVNTAKTLDKEVKALKAKLSDEELSRVTLDAKINELQGKGKQAEEAVKAMEKERDLRYAEHIQKLNTVKSEVEQKLYVMDQRQTEAEAMVAKGERFTMEATSVRLSGKVKQHELLSKAEEITNAFHNYSTDIGEFLQRIEAAAEKGTLEPETIYSTTEADDLRFADPR